MAPWRHFLCLPEERKKSAGLVVFFLRGLLIGLGLLTGSAAQSSCPPEAEATAATVEYVHDGDTVFLANGRKLRFIGVDTPEMGDDRRPPEPLAAEARDFVRELLRQHNHKVLLGYDEEPTDAYGRRLAHVFLPDDRSLAEILLSNGLATALVVPPNTRYSSCYAQAEKTARNNRKGLWGLSRYQPINVGELLPKTTGFRVVRGKAYRVRRGERADFIYLGEPESGKVLRIKIAREDRPFFEETLLKTLTGKTVEVRSVIHHHNGRYYTRIRHATALQITTP